ncbi:MAG: SCO family protein [Deltaproteobacteria bacterium]|nr:MAG: SCO family protein [Deltaproteobacteria bacterium]
MRFVLAVVLLAGLDAGPRNSGKGDELGFAPPAPGTYVLQRILRAPEGAVLDMSSQPRRLSRFTSGKITLLSLIYTSCSDGSGCPLASHLLRQLRQRADTDEKLRARLRFVTLSFDPDNDTPEVMRAYADGYLADGKGPPWHFLTTRSRRELVPVLRGFGQDVWVSASGSDEKAGRLPHLLKAFLIDRNGWIREIYTTSFFQPQMVLNDMTTLMLEEER